MDVELRTIPGCPNRKDALELFQRALSLEGSGNLIPRVLEAGSDAQTAALGFHGSPSFIADGRDLFPSSGAPAVSCRVC